MSIPLSDQTSLRFDAQTKSVKLTREVRLQRLVLEQQTEAAQPGEKTAALLRDNLSAEDLGPDFGALRRRLELYRQHSSNDVPTDEDLLMSFLTTIHSWNKSRPRELTEHARGLLPYSLLQDLDKKLPTSFQLPGRRKPALVHYPPDGNPYVVSKLQDFMGWTQPRLFGGRVELVFHLLAPNGRACQITNDLESFWSGSYQQVRKDLRGRYPKHHWPEDPARNPRRERK